MDDQKQADIVDKMIKTSGKFNGSGFSEWYEQAMDCFRLRSEGIFAIVQGQPCPRPVYQTSRRSRSMSRERRRTTAESRAVAAEAEAAAAASAAQEAITAAIAAGNDNDGVAAAAQRAAVRAAAEAATAAAAAADSFENDGDNSENSTASSDVPVDFTYESATELPTSLLWAIPATVTNRDDILAWHRFNRMLDPDAFMHDMTELRDELQLLGSPIPDDQVLNIILDCPPQQLYSGIKYEAETKEDLNLEQALYTMRNLYINRKEESGTLRAAKGRSSAITIGTAAAAPEVASSMDATKVNATKETGSTTGISSADKTATATTASTATPQLDNTRTPATTRQLRADARRSIVNDNGGLLQPGLTTSSRLSINSASTAIPAGNVNSSSGAQQLGARTPPRKISLSVESNGSGASFGAWSGNLISSERHLPSGPGVFSLHRRWKITMVCSKDRGTKRSRQ
eukprot:g19430.t1